MTDNEKEGRGRKSLRPEGLKPEPSSSFKTFSYFRKFLSGFWMRQQIQKQNLNLKRILIVRYVRVRVRAQERDLEKRVLRRQNMSVVTLNFFFLFPCGGLFKVR